MTVESDTRFWDKTAKSYSKSSISDQAGYQRTLDKTRSFLKPTDRVLELGNRHDGAAPRRWRAELSRNRYRAGDDQNRKRQTSPK
jgi:hypothetical protein